MQKRLHGYFFTNIWCQLAFNGTIAFRRHIHVVRLLLHLLIIYLQILTVAKCYLVHDIIEEKHAGVVSIQIAHSPAKQTDAKFVKNTPDTCTNKVIIVFQGLMDRRLSLLDVYFQRLQTSITCPKSTSHHPNLCINFLSSARLILAWPPAKRA